MLRTLTLSMLCFSVSLAYAQVEAGFSLPKPTVWGASKAPGTNPASASQRFEASLEHLQQNKLDVAQTELLSLIQDYPELPEPFSNLSVVYAKQGYYFQSADVLAQGLKIHPDHKTLKTNLQTLDRFIATLPQEHRAVAPELMNIRKGVTRWRDAWAAKDFDMYVSSYSTQFVPSNGLTRDAWLTRRKERLTQPKEIDLDLSNLAVRLTSSRTADVTFSQLCTTPLLTLNTRKTLKFYREPSGWKIVREQTENHSTVHFVDEPSQN
jgi:tetratricopeptide (TPR) repeat protein